VAQISRRPNPHRGQSAHARLLDPAHDIEIENPYLINAAYEEIFLRRFVPDNELNIFHNKNCDSLYLDDRHYTILRHGVTLRHRPAGYATSGERYPEQFGIKWVNKELQRAANKITRRQLKHDSQIPETYIRNEIEIAVNDGGSFPRDARELRLEDLPEEIQTVLRLLLGDKKAKSLVICPQVLTSTHRILIPLYFDAALTFQAYPQPTKKMSRKETYFNIEAVIDHLKLWQPPKNIPVREIYTELAKGERGLCRPGPKKLLFEHEAKLDKSGIRLSESLVARGCMTFSQVCLDLPREYRSLHARISPTHSKARFSYGWLLNTDGSYAKRPQSEFGQFALLAP
jgi:hypothetical protein